MTALSCVSERFRRAETELRRKTRYRSRENAENILIKAFRATALRSFERRSFFAIRVEPWNVNYEHFIPIIRDGVLFFFERR